MLNFQSKITIKLLRYYFVNPNRKHYINELAKIIAVDPGNLFRKLKELEGDGLFLSQAVGSQRFFYLNKRWPLLGEYKKIFELKFGLPEILKKEFKKVKGLQEAYIFGSYIKGNLQEASDIDVLLIGSHDPGDIFKIINPLEKSLGREINIIDYSQAEFTKKIKDKDFFLKNVFTEKTIKII